VPLLPPLLPLSCWADPIGSGNRCHSFPPSLPPTAGAHLVAPSSTTSLSDACGHGDPPPAPTSSSCRGSIFAPRARPSKGKPTPVTTLLPLLALAFSLARACSSRNRLAKLHRPPSFVVRRLWFAFASFEATVSSIFISSPFQCLQFHVSRPLGPSSVRADEYTSHRAWRVPLGFFPSCTKGLGKVTLFLSLSLLVPSIW
jgi:hypothetical protein